MKYLHTCKYEISYVLGLSSLNFAFYIIKCFDLCYLFEFEEFALKKYRFVPFRFKMEMDAKTLGTSMKKKTVIF